MAAGIEEPTGKAAGRVTIVTTLTSLIPPVVVSGVLILCAVLEIISHEVAGIAILTALGLGAATTGTVFSTAKHTKTDQAAVVWGSPPVSDIVTPSTPVSAPVVTEDAQDAVVVAEGTEGDAAANLAAEVEAVRNRNGSTAGGVS
ncbi:hypothetical protein ACFYE2_00405 [Kocuria sp. CPCC 205300]|uniref:hypothetical protein n=1 Tax=Kocuria sabuli TaxID=3071448 RepID=UPI0036D7EF37